MNCVYEPESINFECLRNIITKIRGQQIDVELFRMILKQLDSGLALFGLPKKDDPGVSLPEASVSEFDLQGCTVKLELIMDQVALMDAEDVSAQRIPVMQIILILLEIWKQLEPILNPPA